MRLLLVLVACTVTLASSLVLTTLLRYQVSLLLVLVACTVTLASSLVLTTLCRDRIL
jgi:hypothetical protein